MSVGDFVSNTYRCQGIKRNTPYAINSLGDGASKLCDVDSFYNMSTQSEKKKKKNIKPYGRGSSTSQACTRIANQFRRMLEECQVRVSQGSLKKEVWRCDKKAMQPRCRRLTHESRATVENVLDGRTVLLLERLLKRGVFDTLYGCLSTGKEANVYLGTLLISKNDLKNEDSEVKCRALKVYRTSILSFKDRARYVQGEFRFRTGYMGSRNPRKMVKQWAEKEFRNLRRMYTKGVRCPVPLDLRGHVLAMGFLGTPALSASCRLKDLSSISKRFPTTFWVRLYVEIIVTLRQLYHDCKLVHGDFSEYNILFHQGHCYIIDVSQSVENDHPGALEFLKRDCVNVFNFFKKKLDDNMKSSLECCQEDFLVQRHLDDNFSDETSSGSDSDPLLEYDSLLMITRNFIEKTLEVASESFQCSIRALTPRELFNYVTCPNTAFMELNEYKEKDICVDLIQSIQSNPKRIDSDAEQIAAQWPEFDTDYWMSEAKDYTGPVSQNANELLYPKQTQEYVALIDTIRTYRKQFNEACFMTLMMLSRQKKSVKTDEGAMEENIFLLNWIPSDTHQITSYKQLENLIECRREGEATMYDALLAPKPVHTTQELPQGPVLGTSIVHNNNNNNKKKEQDVAEQDSSDQVSSPKENEKPKFTGKIPENIDPKEWKRMVKQNARLRRLTKIPKYLKKKHKQRGKK